LVYPAFMKIKITCLCLALFCSSSVLDAAETTSGMKSANASEVEMLRKLLEVQKRHPDKVIRHPDEVITAQAVTPLRPTQPMPPVAQPAPPPAAQVPATPPPAAPPVSSQPRKNIQSRKISRPTRNWRRRTESENQRATL
jgi:hypothetical protein